MEITQGINQIIRTLKDDKYDSEEKLKIIGWSLPDASEYKFISHKDLLLKQAETACHSKFRLIATMNSQISIFNWCDSQFNFIGMCNDRDYVNDNKDYTVEYTLEELPKVIDSAERWLKGIKEGKGCSGSPYFVSSLQLMGC